MRRSIPIVSGFVFLAFSVLALGQSTIYKLQQAEGRTVYSDKKLPNTKVQKELKESDSELSTVAPLASGKQSQETDNRFNAQIAQRDELWRERNLAQADLDLARRAKANGEEPMPGERTGNAAGRSRLNDTYWSRQDLLQRAIDSAQRRLERAEQNLRAAGN